ncbi:hypothetical protein [Glycomyces harbinensis]|uniref:Uncharacterized protein n=1 Tax=Glycomyces harbinensis TaxID=58114 RepID=A0A1G6Y3A5_9ACTN|nr:hypothetical protein [Glycomyces harbinensis]SDD84772.1 hypothetical protein SAMN05216270_108106 [Glycomyces harbinensis]
MNDPEPTFTDLDEYVTLRVDDGKIIVQVTAAGFRQPPNVIAGLVTELAGRLPRPGAGSDGALAEGVEAIGRLQQAAATGGYEAFAAMMRGRLGIEAPAETLSRDPEVDRAIANRLDGVLKSMRQAQSARAEPAAEVLNAEVYTDEGDLSVTSSSERAVAGVWIGPAARYRGIDGLGEALTSLIARARAELRAVAEERAREAVPAQVAETIDNAPEDAQRAGGAAMQMIERIQQINETIQRKAGH